MREREKDKVTIKVNQFYNAMPFNYSQSAKDFASIIRRGNPIETGYPNFHDLLKSLPKDIKIADIGCGTGWLANSLSYHYRVQITGIDLCDTALQRAREISKELSIEKFANFHKHDLFELDEYNGQFSIVNSLGVLHHTYNCEEAVKKVCRIIADAGHFHLGLYHKYGREPFLNLFSEYRTKLFEKGELTQKEENEAFEIYRALNRNITDENMLRSWFRDQVLHPHETQHTLEEVYAWLNSLGFEILSTSINRFQPIQDIQSLFDEEKKYFEISIEKNIRQRTYFPGFFTVLAKKGD